MTFTRKQPTEQCGRAFLSKYEQLREIMDMIDGDECPHIPLLYVPFSLHGWLLYPDISFPLCISRLSNKQRTKQGSMITVYQSSSSPPKRPPPLMSTSSSSSSSSFSSSFFSSAAGAAAAAAAGAAAPTPVRHNQTQPLPGAASRSRMSFPPT